MNDMNGSKTTSVRNGDCSLLNPFFRRIAMKAKSWKIAMILAGIGWSASVSQATLIVYEGFDYGQTSGSAIGLGGSELGLTGTWTENTAGQTVAQGAAKNYNPTGLTLGNLAVTGGNLNLSTTGGGNDYLQRQHTASVATGGTLWGSYLWKPITNSNTVVTNNTVQSYFDTATLNGADATAEISAAGKGWITTGTVNDGIGSVSLDATTNTVTGNNTGVTIPLNPGVTGATYMVLFRVTNVGNVGAVGTEWILNAAQFNNFTSGGITEAALDAATTGTAVTNVLQKGSVTSTAAATFNANSYANFQVYRTASADFDELRISDASGDTGLAEVTSIIPEPATLGLLALGGMMLVNGRKAIRRV
ncbi:MAG: PEP-CTERM sorting domain-containing protein [Phycisphaerales bacterium]